ncbi:E3 12.5 kDa protein [Simian adenovirus 3]|uniref:E3 12.5 kDa protein n=1 Tax=Simian adenovirus 3 TaxID=38420 RepID=A0A9W3HRL1_9ADEN|nr:E3 12.5 kDa protein [Simian adenovirus 3]AAT84634.1 E3 12.5 kDa protein [Simian adenovirus 3]
MTDVDATSLLVEQARLNHLVRCRRRHCVARDLSLNLKFFKKPSETGNAVHGLELVGPEKATIHVLRNFVENPILVKRDQGPFVISLLCTCNHVDLHDSFMDHLCAEYNK